jgi:hypothetical protein
MNSIEPCASFHTETIGTVEKWEPNSVYPAVDVVFRTQARYSGLTIRSDGPSTIRNQASE